MKLEIEGKWRTTFFAYIGFNVLGSTQDLGTGLFFVYPGECDIFPF